MLMIINYPKKILLMKNKLNTNNNKIIEYNKQNKFKFINKIII